MAKKIMSQEDIEKGALLACPALATEPLSESQIRWLSERYDTEPFTPKGA